MLLRPRRAFTLIELLVVIAIIAILAVVVVLTLNPAQLLAQSRDANRVSDLATLNSAIGLYQTDVPTGSLGTSSVIYTSLPDASSTCGTQGLLTLPASDTYNCASPTSYRTTNGTGWIPLDFNQISSGSPFGSLPTDPTNQSSSGLYYTYTTNGSQYELTASMESQKYQNAIVSTDGQGVQGFLTKGTNLTLNPVDYIASNDLNIGLVGHWPLDEGTGTVAYDSSANGNSGTWQGTAAGTSGYYSAGHNQSWAGAFNGSSNFVQASSSPAYNMTSSVSVCTWIDPSNVSGAQRVITKGFGGGGTNSLWYLFINGGYIHFAVNDTGFNDAGTPIAAGSWTFVCGVYDGANRMTYINGTLAYEAAYTTPINVNTQMLYIGYGYGGQYFNGLQEGVRIYSRVLAPSEIQKLYALGR
jgi:prepilin-type N-terminal cleavage/methylation domain-containing protein